jgi:2-phosphosulfolactate phosphatase
VPGLDFGNSPASIAPLDLSGVTLVEYSAGGVRGLIDCDHASEVLAGSLVCARATAEYIRSLEPAVVTFVITGLWTDRDGDEDHACADLIEAYLLGQSPALPDFEERVRRSDFGRRFGHPDHPHLPFDDLDLCARADRFDFAMPMRHDGDRLVIEPERMRAGPGVRAGGSADPGPARAV